MSGFNHFDLLAPFYDRYIKPFDPKKLYTLSGLPISGNLLDAGGGTGRVAQSLKSWVNNVMIADSSIGMLSQAVKKGDLSMVCSNTEQLPFKDESFERVIMVDALHHVFDYRATLKELWRVVMVGGRIVIEEPDIRTMPVKILAIIEKLVLMRSHFVSPLMVSAIFNYQNASVHIENQESTTWVVVDKRK